jgi:hypothetical protein
VEPLAAARCRIHPDREAVARCPSCEGFFCRECVTENAGRFVCAACLRAAAAAADGPRVRGEVPRLVALTGIGLGCLWFLFYGAGRVLILLPASFHEGTLWGLK